MTLCMFVCAFICTNELDMIVHYALLALFGVDLDLFVHYIPCGYDAPRPIRTVACQSVEDVFV